MLLFKTTAKKLHLHDQITFTFKPPGSLPQFLGTFTQLQKASISFLCPSVLTQYRAGDNIEKNEMGGACGTYGERERCAQGFGGET